MNGELAEGVAARAAARDLRRPAQRDAAAACAATSGRACASAAGTSSTRTRTSSRTGSARCWCGAGCSRQTDLVRATEIVVRDEAAARRGAGRARRSSTRAASRTRSPSTSTRCWRKVFAWDEGTYAFEEEPRTTPAGELTLKLSTGELILEAVQAVQDPDVVRYALGDIDRVLALSSDPLLRFQKLTLSPTDGFVLSRVDGTTTRARDRADDPAARRGDAEEPVRPALDGRHRVREERTPAPEAGAAHAPARGAGRRRPRPRRPPAAATARTRAARAAAAPPPGRSARRAAAAQPRRRAARPRPAPAPADDEGRRARREILDAWEGSKTRNHFEVLGLPRASSEAEVKDAYFRLAKRFHPDVHHGESLGDLRDKLEAVFIRLGEAYETLRDPRRRGDYEERLGRRGRGRPASRRGAGAAAAAGAAPRATPRRSEAEAARGAEEAMRRAAKLVRGTRSTGTRSSCSSRRVERLHRQAEAARAACCSPAATSRTRSGSKRAEETAARGDPRGPEGASTPGRCSGDLRRAGACTRARSDVPQGARAEAGPRGGAAVPGRDGGRPSRRRRGAAGGGLLGGSSGSADAGPRLVECGTLGACAASHSLSARALHAASADVVVLLNGDRVTGEVVGRITSASACRRPTACW